MQILNRSHNHWICLSSIGCPADTVEVFDNLRPSNGQAGKDIKEVIASILFTDSPIQLIFPDIQQQRSLVNCGLFALAFAFQVCSGKRPEIVSFHEHQMQSHLLSCINDQHMKPFPSTARLRRHPVAALTRSINVYCSCRLPDTGDRMLQCDSCQRWYHFTCVYRFWQCSQCKH